MQQEPTDERGARIMGSKLNKRQEQIAQLLHQDGEVKIAEMRSRFQVSDMTLRRDLELLERQGAAYRTFGGAIAVPQRDVDLIERAEHQTNEKMRIGRKAAELVQSNQAVFIDSGTTTLQLVKYWPDVRNTTVVTNALNIAMELQRKSIPTLVIGGLLREATSSLVGPIAEETLGRMAFDRVFIGAAGFTVEHGFSNSNVFESEVKRTAISQAADITVLIDHSKFGLRSLASFADLTQVNRIITDRPPGSELAEACRQSGVELFIADES